MIEIDPEKCDACGICEKACPFGAIAVAYDLAETNEQCTLCGACAAVRPRGAVSIQRKQPSAEQLAEYQGVFIWAECDVREGVQTPKRVVYELLGQGRLLADELGEELVAVLLGDERETALDRLSHHGADRILDCRHPLLNQYATDSFAHVLSAVISKEKPSVFLYGATSNGRDLAPRIAARLRLGLTADCTKLEIDGERQLVQTRPAFGGNIIASIISPCSRPQMATVRPNVFRALEPDCARPPHVEEFPVTLNKAIVRTRTLQKIPLQQEGRERIEEAGVIISAGRGCQSPAHLDPLRELARELGGVLAGSRAIVDLGWIPHTLQVGQSGATVCPELYVAVGISGAVQHIVGMSSSRKVIAINKDPEAPIFGVADLAIVGDALQIVPRLLEQLKATRGENDYCRAEFLSRPPR